MELHELYKKLRKYLSVPVPKDPWEHIFGLESIRYELSEARCNVLQELMEARAKMLVPKDSQWTDLDRRTMLDGFTAEKEKDLQFLKQLEVIVSDRIQLVIARTKETYAQEPSLPDNDLGH